MADVAELVTAYDVEDCSTVAHQVVELVAVRLAETQTRIGELVALAAQLQTVSARLADSPDLGCLRGRVPVRDRGAGARWPTGGRSSR